jgi:hypothetical protein
MVGQIGNGVVEIRSSTTDSDVVDSAFLDLGNGNVRFTLRLNAGSTEEDSPRRAPRLTTLDPFLTVPHPYDYDTFERRDPRNGQVLEKTTRPGVLQRNGPWVGDDRIVNSDNKVSRTSFDGAVEWEIGTDGTAEAANDRFVVVRVDTTNKIVVLDAASGKEHLVLDTAPGAAFHGCTKKALLMSGDRLVVNCEPGNHIFAMIAQL